LKGYLKQNSRIPVSLTNRQAVHLRKTKGLIALPAADFWRYIQNDGIKTVKKTLTVSIIYDLIYCGFYLGYGTSFLWKYWYVTVYYIAPWMVFLLTGWWIDKRNKW